MKKRHNPFKPQNEYGGDYNCKNYDCRSDGNEFCHDEHNVGWVEFIKWAKTKDNKLVCKGNRHNCMSLRQKWLASLPDDKK